MSVSTHDHSQVDLGERLLVTGLMLMLVTETLLATAALIQLAWVHLLLGIASVGVALYLANWIYTGDRLARRALVGWAGLQVFLSAAAVLAYFAAQGDDHAMRLFGIAAPSNGTAISLGLLKLATYLYVGYALSQLVSVKNFLRVKAGKEPRAMEPASVAPSGIVVALNDKDKQSVVELGKWMQWSGLALIAVGLLSLIAAANAGDRVALIQGALVLALGAVMLGPVSAIRQMSPDQLDLAYLLHAMGQLKALYSKQVAIFGGLAVFATVTLIMLFR